MLYSIISVSRSHCAANASSLIREGIQSVDTRRCSKWTRAQFLARPGNRTPDFVNRIWKCLSLNQRNKTYILLNYDYCKSTRIVIILIKLSTHAARCALSLTMCHNYYTMTLRSFGTCV
uniref:Uncharacterized protein n=1 Tax=Pararge aegeria TaxID=116150 RepID=S4P0F8_9NEOP